MQWLSTIGKIVYDPPRPGLRGNRTEWWCVVEVDDEISHYYRWWLKKQLHLETVAPAWRSHVTVVGGTEPKNNFKKNWRWKHGEKIELKYSPCLQTYGEKRRSSLPPHWWLPVSCPELYEIRYNLCLMPKYPFHITIGREKW